MKIFSVTNSKRKNNEVKIITVNGKRTIPSVVTFVKENEMLVGEPAMKKILGNSKQAKKLIPNTVYEVKRLIGVKYDDPSIQQDLKSWPYKVVPDSDTCTQCHNFLLTCFFFLQRPRPTALWK